MTVEVKTRLTLDEANLARGLSRTERSFARVAKEAHKTGGFIRQAMSFALGTDLQSMMQSARSGAINLVKSFADVAKSSEKSTKSFTGLYGMFRDIPFEQAAAEARSMKDELRDMAVEIGEKPAEAYASFQTLARAMGADTAEEMARARQQTEQLMVVADALGMEVGELTGEFAMFAKAPRIMRGPMFDILRATGLFGKDLVTMNKRWTQMSETAKQAGLAQALEIQSKKLRGVADSWEDQSDRIDEIIRQAKEAVGKPFLEAMMPAATQFIQSMKAALPMMKEGGKALGEYAAQKLIQAFEAGKQAFAYLKAHSREIKEWLSSAADKIREAFRLALEAAKFIYAHKELFVGAVVGAKVAGGVSAAGTAAGGLAKGLGAAGPAATGVGGVASLLRLLGSGSVIAGAGVVTAALAAIAAVGAAGYNAVKLAKEVKKGDSASQDAAAKVEAAQRMLNEGRWEEARAMLVAAKEVKKKSRYGSLGVEGMAAAEKRATEVESQQKQISAMYSHAVDNFGRTIDESSGRTQKLVSELVDTWNAATAANDSVMQAQVANVLLQSQASRDILIMSGLQIAGGINKMDELVVNAYRKFLADIGAGGEVGGTGAGGAGEAGHRARREEMRKAMKAGGAKAGGVEVNMSGGQTFNIKQDFRDQDPDRIAVVFQRDMVRAALNRRTSRMTSIFGSI